MDITLTLQVDKKLSGRDRLEALLAAAEMRLDGAEELIPYASGETVHPGDWQSNARFNYQFWPNACETIRSQVRAIGISLRECPPPIEPLREVDELDDGTYDYATPEKVMREDLRALIEWVRGVLRKSLPAAAETASPSNLSPTNWEAATWHEVTYYPEERIENDAQFAAWARRVLQHLRDDQKAVDSRSGPVTSFNTVWRLYDVARDCALMLGNVKVQQLLRDPSPPRVFLSDGGGPRDRAARKQVAEKFAALTKAMSCTRRARKAGDKRNTRWTKLKEYLSERYLRRGIPLPQSLTDRRKAANAYNQAYASHHAKATPEKVRDVVRQLTKPPISS